MKKVATYFIAFLLSFNGNVFAAQSPLTDDRVIHLLNRITFGARPGDIEHVKTLGLQGYIEEQLNPNSIAESPYVQNVDAYSPANRQSAETLIGEYRQNQKAVQQAKRAAQNGEVQTPNGVKQFFKSFGERYAAEKLVKAIESPRQLNEVMTEFWYNHFNVCMTKGLDRVLVEPYERDAIRPYALGRFRDLLGATCHHPAMLFYLDNWQNTDPKSAGARGQFTGINENYARELMELHTLGVDGGYSQRDVQELARILTGLGLGNERNPRLEKIDNYGAYFDPNRHDFGSKTLLGRHISGSGEREVEEALDMLSRQPATAHHISFQLAQYFVSDDPPASLVNKLTARFQQTNGDIKAVLRELLYSPEFWAAKSDNSKYKTPLRYVVSALRAADAHPKDFRPVNQFLRLQGEPLYGCLTPDGYKNTKTAWLNPDALLYRINFATAFGAGKLTDLLPEAPEYRRLGYTISGSKFKSHTVAVIAKTPDELKSSAILGSPDFMRY
jgi:uncharacterized protein (DUF1800 family)